MEARGGPSLYGPPQLLQCKTNGFCNISYAMEAPWRLGRPVSVRASTVHGGSGRPVSVRASTGFAL